MFSVTYDIVTQESAEHGDICEGGYIIKKVCLREAINALFETRTNQVDGIQAIELCNNTITVSNGMEFLTGSFETRYLHIPGNATKSTINRIYKMVNK